MVIIITLCVNVQTSMDNATISTIKILTAAAATNARERVCLFKGEPYQESKR